MFLQQAIRIYKIIYIFVGPVNLVIRAGQGYRELGDSIGLFAISRRKRQTTRSQHCPAPTHHRRGGRRRAVALEGRRQAKSAGRGGAVVWWLERAVAGWGWGRTPGESYSLTSQTGPSSFQGGARVISPGMILNLHQQHTSAVAQADTHTRGIARTFRRYYTARKSTCEHEGIQ